MGFEFVSCFLVLFRGFISESEKKEPRKYTNKHEKERSEISALEGGSVLLRLTQHRSPSIAKRPKLLKLVGRYEKARTS